MAIIYRIHMFCEHLQKSLFFISHGFLLIRWISRRNLLKYILNYIIDKICVIHQFLLCSFLLIPIKHICICSVHAVYIYIDITHIKTSNLKYMFINLYFNNFIIKYFLWTRIPFLLDVWHGETPSCSFRYTCER